MGMADGVRVKGICEPNISPTTHVFSGRQTTEKKDIGMCQQWMFASAGCSRTAKHDSLTDR